jgi:hypothetical protein
MATHHVAPARYHTAIGCRATTELYAWLREDYGIDDLAVGAARHLRRVGRGQRL